MGINVKIQASNLSKSYGRTLAVADVTIDVNSGEIVGFLGPNGAGKTTTLKILTGLLRPDKGIVRIDGIDLHERPAEAKSILGYVPDVPHLYEKLTVLEFLLFISEVFKLDKSEAARRITDLISLFDLIDHKNKLTGTLSHGTKQKVSLAAAILHRPRVLLLDEPTGGLDPRATRKIKDVIAEMAKGGCAILFSTHILEIAESICDSIYIINKGKIVARGNIEQLRNEARGSTLEELFIELTGGSEYDEVVKFLRN